MVGSAWTESTGSGASAPPVSPDLTAESVSDDMRIKMNRFLDVMAKTNRNDIPDENMIKRIATWKKGWKKV